MWSSLDTSLPGWVSTDPFHSGYTITVPLWGLSSWHQCKGVDWVVPAKGAQCLVLHILCGGQLRFSLSSGAVITRHWSQLYPIYWSSNPSSADAVLCLMPSLLMCCSCLLFLCRTLLVLQLFHCVSMSAVLGFCSLFYTEHILLLPSHMSDLPTDQLAIG